MKQEATNSGEGNLSDETIDRIMYGAAAFLELHLPSEFTPGIRENLRALLRVGATLNKAGDTPASFVEIAPVFRA